MRIKAINLCQKKDLELSSSRKSETNISEIDVNDLNGDAKDLTKEMVLTVDEQAIVKAENINYEIEAMELNKIDELSIENTESSINLSIISNQKQS